MHSPKIFRPRRMAGLAASLALLVVGAAPALAGTLIYPGTACTSEGEVSRPASGALMNADLGYTGSRTLFSCPILRTRSTTSPYAYTLSVRLNVVRGIFHANWDCALRGVDSSGAITASTSIYVDPWYGSGAATISKVIDLPVPGGIVTRSYSLRCNVPTSSAGTSAGIVSIEVSD